MKSQISSQKLKLLEKEKKDWTDEKRKLMKRVSVLKSKIGSGEIEKMKAEKKDLEKSVELKNEEIRTVLAKMERCAKELAQMKEKFSSAEEDLKLESQEHVKLELEKAKLQKGMTKN